MNSNDLNKKTQFFNKKVTLGIIAGVFIGSIITLAFTGLISPSNTSENSNSIEKKPLYWIAPMDENYKRNKPGKSPMGMDLIPVYETHSYDDNQNLGQIRISANVVNNLGVRTAKVAYQTLNTQINTFGYITYNEDKFIDVHPRVQGWIEQLYIKAIGEPIKKGQPLYDIYSPELVNAQEEFLLALARQNNQLINAALNRLEALQLSKETIAQLKKTRKPQQKITFYASQSGVVESLAIREGFFVKPETQMLSIVDLSEVWVKAEVFERQSSLLSVGNEVVMTLDYLPNKQWHGKIEHIHPMLNPKTRTTIVRLRFDNTNGELKPNMFAQIAINTTSNKPTLLIPKEALIRTGRQDRVVLALGEGRYKSIAVKIGRFDTHNVEIISGLNEGDEIVSSAQFLLDSESSKTSDFKRMNHDSTEAMSQIDMPQNSQINTTHSVPPSAQVTGTINSLMIEHGMINISRSAIKKWHRPAATIDFITSDKVSLAGLSQGDKVNFTFEIHEGKFVIVEISKRQNHDTGIQ
ncbi:efflux RND transporter periplasmic adaptor subunit [Thalassotalea piscium]